MDERGGLKLTQGFALWIVDRLHNKSPLLLAKSFHQILSLMETTRRKLILNAKASF